MNTSRTLALIGALTLTCGLTACGGGHSSIPTPSRSSAAKKTQHAAPAKAAAPVVLEANQTISRDTLATYLEQHGQQPRQADKDSKDILTACQNMNVGQPVTTATKAFAMLEGAHANLIADTIFKLCPADVAAVPFFNKNHGESYQTMPAVPTRIAKEMQGMLNQ